MADFELFFLSKSEIQQLLAGDHSTRHQMLGGYCISGPLIYYYVIENGTVGAT